MAKHMINREDLKEFIHEFVIAAANSKDVNKTLSCKIYVSSEEVMYKVVNHGQFVFIGHDMDMAIQCYNAI